MKQKNLCLLCCVFFVMLMQIACTTKETMNQETNEKKIIKKVRKVSGDSIEFELDNDFYKRSTYMLIKDSSNIVEEGEVTGNILILNSLEFGEYSIVFKVESQVGTYKTLPYDFSVEKVEKMIKLNYIKSIQKDEVVEVELEVENISDQEVYIKDLASIFYDSYGDEITQNISINSEFVPIMLKSEKSVILSLAYKSDLEIEGAYIELDLEGYTEENRKLIKLLTDKRYSKIIKPEDINIEMLELQDSTLESEYITGKIVLKGTDANVRVEYGTQEKNVYLRENEQYNLSLKAEASFNEIKVKIPMMNLEKIYKINIISKDEIKTNCAEIININDEFDLEILMPKDTERTKIQIKTSKELEVLGSIDYSKFKLKAVKIGSGKIDIYYADTYICSCYVEIKEKEKLQKNIIYIEEANDTLECEIDIFTENENLYKYIGIEAIGVTELEITGENHELLSKQSGKAKMCLKSKKVSKDYSISIKYEEVETGEIYNIKIF